MQQVAAQSKKKKKREAKEETALKASSLLMLLTFSPKQQSVDFIHFAVRTERASQFRSKDFQSRCFCSVKRFSVSCLLTCSSSKMLESWNRLQGQQNIHPHSSTLFSICHKISQSARRSWKELFQEFTFISHYNSRNTTSFDCVKKHPRQSSFTILSPLCSRKHFSAGSKLNFLLEISGLCLPPVFDLLPQRV